MAKNVISTSKREIYSKVLDIAEKYLPVEEYDFAKTGLFAYVTESIAMAMRDSAFHAGMMYNESFLNTAVIPKSVYNWAKMFNIEVQKATPAYADIVIAIDALSIDNFLKAEYNDLTTEEKDKYGSFLVNKTNFLVIDRDDPIVAGDYYFSLERSIVLYKSGDKYVAEYITSEVEFTDYTHIDATNASCYITEESNVIKVSARAYQYKMTTYNNKIVSSSFLNKVQTYTFEDQFCGAVLYYKENGKKVKINLTYSDLSAESASQSAFYNISDEGKLELIFKTGDNLFSPAANSNIILKIYTTKGKNIPNKFTGTGLINQSKSDRRALPITVTFEPTTIYGGKNAPSLAEIKKTIINEISTRKTITTQADLNNYFSILTTLMSDINNGRIKFIKQRDDVLRRIYNAYLLVRSNINDTVSGSSISVNQDASFISPCIPTNTLDIDVAYTSTGSESATSVINLQSPYAYLNGTVASNIDYDYQCPFTIFAKLEPVIVVKYIYESVDKTTKLNYTSAGTGNFFNSNYIHPETLRVYRPIKGDNSISADSKIFFDAVVTSNTNLNNYNFDFKISGETDNTVLTSKNAEVVLIGQNDSGSILTYRITGEFTVTALEVKEDGYNLQGFNDTITTLNVRGNEGSAAYRTDELFNITLSLVGEGEANNEITFRAASQLPVFRDLSDIMESSVLLPSITSTVENEHRLRLTDVPLVSKIFINTATAEAKTEFARQLFNYIDLLKDNLSRLETSTFFNLKFYNTCGYSYMYHTSRTNIELDMEIHLTDQYKNSANISSIKAEIRSFIRRIVDKMNEDEKGIRYSDIIRLLTDKGTYGNYIDHIEFKGPYNQQFIKPTELESDIGYAPEWLNVISTGLPEDENDSSGIFSIQFK